MHVAVIPDGNRRWARARGLPAYEGHRAGAQAFQRLLESRSVEPIQWLTFWAASIANLRDRPPQEVAVLTRLFREYFRLLESSTAVHEQRVRVHVLGAWSEYLPQETQASIRKLVASTARNSSDRNLALLVAYDGTRAMVEAIQAIADRARQQEVFEVSDATIRDHLVTRDLPPVDLLIRTGGEPHLSSGFLMWECANVQLAFLDCCWPDFTPETFKRVLEEFRSRPRRFGA